MSKKYGPSGALFKVDRKNSDKSPDYNGNLEIDEKMLGDIAMEIQQSPERKTKVNLSAWIRQAKSGKTYMSILPSTETERASYKGGSGSGGGRPPAEPMQPQHASQPPSAPMDDEIPF